MEDQSALEGMKRAELQRLAKNAGIKANMKTDAIIQALKKYYSESGSMSAAEGTSCSEDNRTEDESAVSAMETASSSANEEQETPKNTPPTRAVRRGRKGRKKATKTATKPAAEKSATPEAGLVTEPSGRASRRVTPKTACAPAPAETAPMPAEGLVRRKTRSVTPKTRRRDAAPAAKVTPAPAKVPLRRKTRSVTPKTCSGDAAPATKVTPAPAKVQLRRKTRSVTPKPGITIPVATAPVDVPARRRTFEMEEKTVQKQAVVQSDPEMKRAIIAELEQKATEKLALQSRIPKSRRMVAKAGKPVTPGNKDWSRIHQAQFNKMESIEDYVARKRKRTETMSASVKRAKIAKSVSRVRPTSLSFSSPKPAPTKASLSFSSPKPAPTKALAIKTQSNNKAPTGKAPANKSVTFKMSRLKTPMRAAALRGGAGETRQKRKSTPGPRKSVSVIQTSAKKPSLDLSARRKSVGESAKRKSIGGPVTPFKFGQDPGTPVTNLTGKPVFDLKASLNKLLTYQPHTGKLKPLNVSTRFQATSNIQKAKIAVTKKPALKTRDDRRAGAAQHRANRRANDVMARRGISAC